MDAQALIGILVVVAIFAGIAWRYRQQRRRDRAAAGSGQHGGSGARNRQQ